MLLFALPVVASASGEYGADVYGGGAYNVGVVPAPAPTPTPTGGGGGLIYGSGPLAPGYVNTNPTAVITATTSLIMLSTSSPVSTPALAQTTIQATPGASFTRSLQFRDRDPDVKRLQTYLNAHGFEVTASGGGSPGHETDLFGALTLAALKRFQDAHADEILKPASLTTGTGYFGPATRAYVNSHAN